MKLAFVHNVKRSDSELEAEFDTPETVQVITDALLACGHEVVPLDAATPLPELVARLREIAPELVFNTAEGLRSRTREALYPAVFEELCLPYTGSDAYVLTVTLDKYLTKLVAEKNGVRTPSCVLRVQGDGNGATYPLPCIVKPNFEGSSKGITDASVVKDATQLKTTVERALKAYPEGVIVEDYVPGTDVTVAFFEGLGPEILTPCSYEIDWDWERKHYLPEGDTDTIRDHLSRGCSCDRGLGTLEGIRAASASDTAWRLCCEHPDGVLLLRLVHGRLIGNIRDLLRNTGNNHRSDAGLQHEVLRNVPGLAIDAAQQRLDAGCTSLHELIGILGIPIPCTSGLDNFPIRLPGTARSALANHTSCTFDASSSDSRIVARPRLRLYDYRLKNEAPIEAIDIACPAKIPQRALVEVRTLARKAARALGLRNFARLDFRVRDDGTVFFLEANATPSLEPASSVFVAVSELGLDFTGTIRHIVDNAVQRWERQGRTARRAERARRAWMEPQP